MSIPSCGNGEGPKPITVTIPMTRRITGLGNTTVWKLIAEGKLKTATIGRRRLVFYESIEKLLSSRADQAAG